MSEPAVLATASAAARQVAAQLPQRGPELVVALLLLVLFYVLALAASRGSRHVLGRMSPDSDVGHVVGRVAYWAILGTGLLVALTVAGFPMGALLTGFGIIGAALAIALRDIIANLAAGLFLLAKRPFRIGDVIVVGTNEGRVTDLTIRNTVVEAPDGRMVFLPNSTVLNSVVTNSSAVLRRRVLVEVDVSRSGDPSAAALVISGALSGIKGAFADPPAEAPAIALAAESVRLSGRVWVDTSATSFIAARSDAIEAVSRALSEAGIDLVSPGGGS